MSNAATEASETARAAADSRPLEILARIGFVAYGLVHLLIGAIALQMAWGGNQNEADQSGALQSLSDQPLGPALLWLLAAGLVALALWQLSRAVWEVRDADRTKRLRRRVTFAATAAVYALLALTAARFALGGRPSGAQAHQQTTGSMLGLPFGQLLVLAAGAVVIAVGVSHVHKAVTKRFMKHMDGSAMSAAARDTITRLGQVGYAAKGVALGVVGVLLGYAAIAFDPQKAQGLDGAMRTIAAQPFGQLLLTAVAIGFVAFGIFTLAKSRYRSM